MRNVVSSATETSCRTATDEPARIRRGGEVDAHQRIVELLGNDSSDFEHSTGVVVGNHDGSGHAYAVVDQRARITNPIGHHATGLGHREHPVGDHVRETHTRRNALVPVDDVEVTGCTGIHHQVDALQMEGLRRKGSTHFDIVVTHDRCHVVTLLRPQYREPRWWNTSWRRARQLRC